LRVRAYSPQEAATLRALDFARLPIIAVAARAIFDEITPSAVRTGAPVVSAAGALSAIARRSSPAV